MKTFLLRLAAIFGLSIGALALPTTAFAGGGGGGLCGPGGAGQLMSCHFSGLWADAEYRSVSADNVYTDVSLGAMSGRSLSAGSGAPTNQSSAYIFISRVTSDPANPYGKPIILASLWGSVPVTTEFAMDPSLGGASLTSIAIPVYGFDENGSVDGRIVTLTASWAGSGDIVRSSFSYTYRSGSFMFRERDRSDSRSAASTVSAIDGAADWTSGLDLVYADLYSASDATISVSRA
jgi:hypothetical protein